MIIKYRITHEDDDNFVCEIEFNSNATFYDLHLAIQETCNYDKNLIVNFFLSNSEWDELDEIALTQFDADIQADVAIMAETPLTQYSPYIGQRYIYVFDIIFQRYLHIEIINIRDVNKEDKKKTFPSCILNEGIAPKQNIIEDLDDNILQNIDFELDTDNQTCFDDDIDDEDYDDIDYNEADEYNI